jgi:hypothetical protein
MSDVSFICTGQAGRGGHESAVPVERAQERAKASTLLQCPVCGREARLGFRVMQKLAGSGLEQVDISRLPF